MKTQRKLENLFIFFCVAFVVMMFVTYFSVKKEEYRKLEISPKQDKWVPFSAREGLDFQIN